MILLHLIKNYILCNKQSGSNKTNPIPTLLRDEFMMELHVTELATYYELSFEVKDSSKPSQALTIPLIRIVDKAQ